jgi:hypothetical protein
MFETTVDTSNLNRALRDFAKESRKSLDEILEKETGIVVGLMVGMTPPADIGGFGTKSDGGISPSARKQGEARIASDIAALFPTTRMKEGRVMGMIENGFEFGTKRGKKVVKDYANTIADLERIHNFARSPSTGRVRTGSTGQNMALTTAALRREFIKRKKKQVGMLAAGWLKAAQRLKTAKSKTPAWITRHGSKPGGVDFRKSKSGLTITVRNNMPYFPKNQQRRMDMALRRREHGIRKAIEAMIERKAKRANQKMR